MTIIDIKLGMKLHPILWQTLRQTQPIDVFFNSHDQLYMPIHDQCSEQLDGELYKQLNNI